MLTATHMPGPKWDVVPAGARAGLGEPCPQALRLCGPPVTSDGSSEDTPPGPVRMFCLLRSQLPGEGTL